MHVTYRMPQSVPHFSIKDVISVDIIGGKFAAHMEHSHRAAWELVFLMQGSADVLIGEEWVNIRRNQYVFIHPKVQHDVRLLGNDSEAFICSFIPSGEYPVSFNQVLRGTEYERSIVSLMMQDLKANSESSFVEDGYYDFSNESRTIEVHQMLCCYLEQLSIKSRNVNSDAVAEFCAGLKVKDYDYVVDQVNTYIVKHVSDKVTVSDLAKMVHYNRSWLYRVYRESTGEDIMAVITRYRVDKAKELLKNFELSISEVADLAGFKSSSYFSKRFKAVEGISPSEYRNGLKEGS